MWKIILGIFAGGLYIAGAARAVADCPPGFVPSPRGNICIPRGHVDCGDGRSCPAGTTCLYPRGCRGREGTGPLCGGGGIRCGAEEVYGPTGSCYDPKVTFFCGNAPCFVGGHYTSGPCAPCSQPQQRPNLTACGPRPPPLPEAQPPVCREVLEGSNDPITALLCNTPATTPAGSVCRNGVLDRSDKEKVCDRVAQRLKSRILSGVEAVGAAADAARERDEMGFSPLSPECRTVTSLIDAILKIVTDGGM